MSWFPRSCQVALILMLLRGIAWGDPSVWTYIRVADTHSQGFGLAMGDVDGDERPDIVSAAHLYRNPGGNLTGTWNQVALPKGMDAVAIVDVDGDPRADIIALKANEQVWLEATNAEATQWRATRIGSLPISDHGSGTQGYNTGQLEAGGPPEIALASANGVYYLKVPAEPAAAQDWPHVQVTSDANGEGVGIGDIDGDGDNDICGADRSGTALAWWENPGTGNGNWNKHAVGRSDQHAFERIAVADVNGDGRLDIVVTEENDGRSKDAHTYWFEAPVAPKGVGWVRRSVGVGYGTFGLGVGDMDGDGDSDIVTGENIRGAADGSEQTIVWENVDRGAAWRPHVVDRGKESHHGSRVADMDGDGDLDIISICYDTYALVHLWRNDGPLIAVDAGPPSQRDGGPSADVGGSGADAGAGGDLADDAHRDAVAAGSGSIETGAVPKDAPEMGGGAAPSHGLTGGCQHLPIGNRLPGPSSMSILVLCLLALAGRRTNRKAAVGSRHRGLLAVAMLLACVAVACDGELIATGPSDTQRGDPSDARVANGHPEAFLHQDASPEIRPDAGVDDSHAVGDSLPLDQSTTPVPNEMTFDLTVLDPDASGVFAVADVDGDGRNDIVVAGGDSALSWRRYPSLTPFVIVDRGELGMEIHAADVDGDGDADVLAPEPDTLQVVWFENPRPAGDPKTAPWKRHVVGQWPSGFPHDFKVGDVNDDGRIDAVVCPNVKSPFYLFVQQGASSWVPVVVEGASGLEGTWLADIDGDGDDDITDGRVWIEAPDDPVAGEWPVHPINAYPYDKRRVSVGDINGDGRADVITSDAEFGAGLLAWYEAPRDPRNGEWQEHVMVPLADHNFHTLQLGDVDLDGTLDVLTGSTHYLGENGGYVIRLFLNVGGRGLKWKERSWRAKYGIWQGVLADLGSDGDLDILGANYQQGKAQQEVWANQLDPRTPGTE